MSFADILDLERGKITVEAQIMHVCDIGTSKASQLAKLYEIQAARKQHKTVKCVETDPDSTKSCLKITLKDTRGTLAYAVEYRHIPGLSVLTRFGTNISLREAETQRGIILLTPQTSHLAAIRPLTPKEEDAARQKLIEQLES